MATTGSVAIGAQVKPLYSQPEPKKKTAKRKPPSRTPKPNRSS